MLEPDRNQIEIFVDAVFRHAGDKGFVAVRSFYEDGDKPFRLSNADLVGGLRFLIEVAEDDARRAAQYPKPVVFCPPLAIFKTKDRAREQDLAAGLVLSVECDEHPQRARTSLEGLLGPATVVVRSGGRWVNGAGEEDKLHLHWRLTQPARGSDLALLKQARDLAARIVGGDPSNKPVCHPIRWPGSWHRKAEPRLCEIAALDANREIDLAATLAVLQAAAPPVPETGTAPINNGSDGADWAPLVTDIVNGRSFHQPLVSLAARLIGSGVLDGSVVKLLRALMAASSAPHDELRWQARYDSVPRIVASARDKYGDREKETTAEGRPLLWPYQARQFDSIPRRRWLHAGHYIRGEVVMTVAPGGYGKTSLVLANAIEMATGRGLLGPAPSAALYVAYWNAEDPDEEIERRIAATCLRHNIEPAALQGHFFLGSRLAGKRRIACIERGSGNVVFDTSMLAEIERLIGSLKIDCLIFDPLVAFHRIPEADNMLMEQIIKDGFGEIAARTDCCIELSQHTRKASQGRQGDLTADDSRGAGAIVNAARSVRVLNRMTAEEAELPKITPEERRHYLRVSRDKANLAPPGKAAWVHLVSVELPNGDGLHPGDQVQAVEAWNYPKPFDGVTANDMRWMRDTVRGGDYRRDPRSPDWVGRPLAERLHLDPDDKGDRVRILAILKTWFANGVLTTEMRKDSTRHEREYVVVGTWKDED